MKTNKTDINVATINLLKEMSRHIGERNAIGMAELYRTVYGIPWEHRINDTTDLRKLITGLRRQGVPICSNAATHGGGYYLASAGSELVDYLTRNKQRAIKILARCAQIQKVSLPELLGQMKLEYEAGDAKANA